MPLRSRQRAVSVTWDFAPLDWAAQWTGRGPARQSPRLGPAVQASSPPEAAVRCARPPEPTGHPGWMALPVRPARRAGPAESAAAAGPARRSPRPTLPRWPVRRPGAGPASCRGHGRLERGRRVLQHHRDRVARGRHGRGQAGAGIPELAPGPADRAPLAFRGFVVGGRVLPHVPLPVRAAAERGANLITQSPGHAARPRADQPSLELADRVTAWLPLRHVAPSSLSLSSCVPPAAVACARRPSTRALSPFSAVSMMTFSAFRFSMPSSGTRRSTLSS